jgi:glycerol-3-phosphate dehydrogenase
VRIEHLLGRYGSMIHELLELIAEQPSLGEPLSGTDDYLRAEIVYAATHEGARHLDDVLTRRTRISIETFHRGTQSCEEAAELMRGVLNWSQEQVEREIEHYQQRVAAERESQQMPDDKTADAARMGARDVVPLS